MRVLKSSCGASAFRSSIRVSHTSQTLSSGKRRSRGWAPFLPDTRLRIGPPSHIGTSGDDGIRDFGTEAGRSSERWHTRQGFQQLGRHAFGTVGSPADPARARDAQVAAVLDGPACQADRELSARALQPGANRRPAVPPGLARRRDRQSQRPSGDRGDLRAAGSGSTCATSPRVDRRYRDMLDGMFEEIAAKVPGFEAPNHQDSILISSPDAQVYYHADLPGQGADPDRRPQAGLSSIRTRRRSSTPEHLEDIALLRRRGRYALRRLVRQACQGVRSRTGPDAELAAECAASRRKSRQRSTFR